MTERNVALNRGILKSFGEIYRTAAHAGEHNPSVQQIIKNLCEMFPLVFEGRTEFEIKIIDGLFQIDDKILLEETLFMMDFLKALESQNVSSIVIYPGIRTDEITILVQFFMKKTDVTNVMMERSMARTAASHTQLLFKESIEAIMSLDRRQRQEMRYRHLLHLTDECFSHLINEQTYDFNALQNSINDLIDDVFENATGFIPIITDQTWPNPLSRHAVDTTIYSIFLGHQLELEPRRLQHLALSALLHDVGRMFLPAEFVTGYKLKDQDKEFVQKHVEDGASFLAGVPELPAIVFRVALEHHWGYDGLGYPAFPENYKAHLYSQIVGLADFASWRTTSETWYHQPMPLHRLIRVIMRRAGSQFNPCLVKLLIPLFGFFPSGTKVKLSDGQEGVVEEAVFHNILRPKVRVGGKLYDLDEALMSFNALTAPTGSGVLKIAFPATNT